ncbi:hypothetical protein [Ramlibacter sp.]|uniref:hypothetical protein n=1 Tax=Ramlibacter sp. TaxID=1917967 RepID=UPI0017AD021C|nr:hypothetical protein [Ramlibacter sp.]MBA2673373.1 hypothetical protein [Ramlibacter sp.]
MTASSTPLPNALRVLFCATLAATLVACGGGGSSAPAPAAPAPTPAPAPAAAATQGFWTGSIDGQTTVSAVYLAEGPGITLLQTGPLTTLVVGTATVSLPAFAVTGRRYDIASGTVGNYSAAGTVVPKSTLSFAGAGLTPPYTLSYNPAYEVPARLQDVAGRWQAGFSGGTLTLTLDIAANGAVTGTNSSGCGYGGTVAPHAGGVAVFDVQLTESCPSAAANPLSGIATLNAAKTALSVALVTSTQSAATAFQATR